MKEYVWYHPKTDEIFLSWQLDGCFYGLVGNHDWTQYELLGEF